MFERPFEVGSICTVFAFLFATMMLCGYVLMAWPRKSFRVPLEEFVENAMPAACIACTGVCLHLFFAVLRYALVGAP